MQCLADLEIDNQIFIAHMDFSELKGGSVWSLFTSILSHGVKL